MKKTLIGLTLALATIGTAFAGNGNGNNGNGNGNGGPNPVVVGGGLVIGGFASGYEGTISGNANSVSNSMSVTASQVNGFGTSIQSNVTNTGGAATVGGVITPVGSLVTTDTTTWSNSTSQGSISGNAPIQVGDSLANASAGFGQTEVNAAGYSTFNSGAIGGILAVGAVGAFGGF